MRLSTIDIGTNSVLLLVADVDASGIIRTVRDEQRIPRLGKGVDKDKKINSNAFARVLEVLKEYKDISESLHSEKIIACGTSALRDAVNREELIEFVKEKTGIVMEILSGEDEALWAYLGAVSELPNDFNKVAVIDIGGGSTEISVGDRNTIHNRISLNLGSVRITERFLRHFPPLTQEITSATKSIRDELQKLRPFDLQGVMLIGVAGTVTTLAAIAQNLPTFDLEKIGGYVLTYEVVGNLLQKLCSMALEEIRRIPSMAPGREDVITAGTLILLEFMEFASLKTVVTSERGVRYGLALREWNRESTAGGCPESRMQISSRLSCHAVPSRHYQ